MTTFRVRRISDLQAIEFRTLSPQDKRRRRRGRREGRRASKEEGGGEIVATAWRGGVVGAATTYAMQKKRRLCGDTFRGAWLQVILLKRLALLTEESSFLNDRIARRKDAHQILYPRITITDRSYLPLR